MAKRARSIETDIFGLKVGQRIINSKKKGDKNEREACKWLLRWTGQRFIRTPSSGGRRLVNASNFCGDVVCEDENFQFPFTVETKHLKSVGLKAALGKRSKVYGIWEQAKEDALRASKHPLVMLRCNRFNIGYYVIFVNSTVAESFNRLGIQSMYVGYNGEEFIYGYSSDEVLKIPFDEFL